MLTLVRVRVSPEAVEKCGGDAQRGRQRIFRGPANLCHRLRLLRVVDDGRASSLLEQRIDQRLALAIEDRHRGEADGVPVADVGIRRVAGLRTQHLLEDEDVARLQIGVRAGQSRLRGALGKATVKVSPGVEVEDVVLRKEIGVLHGLEDHDPRVEGGLFVTEQVRRHSRSVGVEAGDRVVEEDRDGHIQADPGARIAAVMHAIADQKGVAAQRDAAARGQDVGFGGDGVLLVAELVAGIGNQFRQHHTQVGLGGSAP